METVDNLKRINAGLYGAYFLKEQILDNFDETEITTTFSRFMRWVSNVDKSDLNAFKGVVKTLRR